MAGAMAGATIILFTELGLQKPVVILAPSLLPVSCVLVEPLRTEESLTTNLGDYKYQDTGEQFSLNEYIPDSSMNDVPIVISCTDAAVLQCIQ